MPVPKKEKKTTSEAKEVQISARKTGGDEKVGTLQGGLSAARREMLIAIRTEEDEAWEDLEFHDGEVRLK